MQSRQHRWCFPRDRVSVTDIAATARGGGKARSIRTGGRERNEEQARHLRRYERLEGDEALLAVRRQIVRCCPRNDRLVINLGLPKTGAALHVSSLRLFLSEG